MNDQDPSAPAENASMKPEAPPQDDVARRASGHRIPAAHQERFDEVAVVSNQMGCLLANARPEDCRS